MDLRHLPLGHRFMEIVMSSFYPWIKAFHVIFVIFWMAGVLYLPRLFAYHSNYPTDHENYDLFLTMERRLLSFIMTPAIVISYILGLGLFFTPGIVDASDKWFLIKIFLVFLLTMGHGLMVCWYYSFKKRRPPHSALFFKIINEIPAFLIIGIVIMVIVRPI
jgi:protoporphyrinogen IX oxidase